MMSVYSVNVYPSHTVIRTGEWYYDAYAVVNDSNNCCTDVEWCSDNTNVATVNASSGYIYGLSPENTKGRFSCVDDIFLKFFIFNGGGKALILPPFLPSLPKGGGRLAVGGYSSLRWWDSVRFN